LRCKFWNNATLFFGNPNMLMKSRNLENNDVNCISIRVEKPLGLILVGLKNVWKTCRNANHHQCLQVSQLLMGSLWVEDHWLLRINSGWYS
jgi:hypothetical protein